MRDIIHSIKIKRVCKLLQLWPRSVKPAGHSIHVTRWVQCCQIQCQHECSPWDDTGSREAVACSSPQIFHSIVGFGLDHSVLWEAGLHPDVMECCTTFFQT